MHPILLIVIYTNEKTIKNYASLIRENIRLTLHGMAKRARAMAFCICHRSSILRLCWLPLTNERKNNHTQIVVVASLHKSQRGHCIKLRLTIRLDMYNCTCTALQFRWVMADCRAFLFYFIASGVPRFIFSHISFNLPRDSTTRPSFQKTKESGIKRGRHMNGKI